MKDNNLIYETDKKFYVNPTYFNKGNMGLHNAPIEQIKSGDLSFIFTIWAIFKLLVG